MDAFREGWLVSLLRQGKLPASFWPKPFFGTGPQMYEKKLGFNALRRKF